MPKVNPTNGSYELYNENDMTVTLTFPSGHTPPAPFEVVTKEIPSGLPTGYTWVINFGIKAPGGPYLSNLTYHLQGSDNKSWFIHYGGQTRAMNGTHENAPGDPPIGYGQT